MATILAVDKDALQLNLLGFLLREDGHKVYATAEPRPSPPRLPECGTRRLATFGVSAAATPATVAE